MIYILTTIGTSVITNHNRKAGKEFGTWFNDLKKSKKFDQEDPVFKSLRENIKTMWCLENGKKNYMLSAEITSLQKIKEANPKEQDFQVQFLLTDTAEAQFSTILLQDFLQNEKLYNKESLKKVHKIKGLQVDNFKEFEEVGLLNLINKVNELKQEFDNRNKKGKLDKIILNLTGGYKGMIPFLTLFGQLYNIEINYIYEMSNEIIKFPQLPIQFDWFKAESYYNYLDEKSIKDFSFDENNTTLKELVDNYLIQVNNENFYTITAVGKLFYKYIEENIIIADRVMGHTMEYKLLEYYMENHYQNKYLYLKRSEDLRDPDHPKDISKKSDIDLLMKENKNSDEFIAIECKPYLHIKNSIPNKDKGFFKQLSFQLELFQKNNYIPKEYLLHIYADNDKENLELLNKNLCYIKELVSEKIPSIKFKVFVFYTEILDNKNKKSPNPYTDFMKNKISEVKELKFN